MFYQRPVVITSRYLLQNWVPSWTCWDVKLLFAHLQSILLNFIVVNFKGRCSGSKINFGRDGDIKLKLKKKKTKTRGVEKRDVKFSQGVQRLKEAVRMITWFRCYCCCGLFCFFFFLFFFLPTYNVSFKSSEYLSLVYSYVEQFQERIISQEEIAVRLRTRNWLHVEWGNQINHRNAVTITTLNIAYLKCKCPDRVNFDPKRHWYASVTTKWLKKAVRILNLIIGRKWKTDTLIIYIAYLGFSWSVVSPVSALENLSFVTA